MPPRPRAATTTTATLSTPSKSMSTPRSSRRTRTSHKKIQQQPNDGSVSPDPLDILPFVSPLKLAKKEILAGSKISPASTETGSYGKKKTGRCEEEVVQTELRQQPASQNWSVNVTIAGTDRILPTVANVASPKKRNFDELEKSRDEDTSSVITCQPLVDSRTAWVQVIGSRNSPDSPVSERDLRVANAGSTPGVVDSFRKRRAVAKISSGKNEIERNYVEDALHEIGAPNQDGPSSDAKTTSHDIPIDRQSPTLGQHTIEPLGYSVAEQASETSNMPIRQESSATALQIYEDSNHQQPPLTQSRPAIENHIFVDRSSSSLNVTQNSQKLDNAEHLSSSSPLKPVSPPPPPHSPILLSQSAEHTLSLSSTPLTKQSSPAPSVPSSILTTTDLPSVPESRGLRNIPNPNPDGGWSRTHWILLTHLHPRRMDPLPSRALVRPPQHIMAAFPGISEEELSRRILALDRIRFRRELEDDRSERRTKAGRTNTRANEPGY
ncbi:hypothetical protein V1509DRAFT_658415 [Lipomyces kononenkoae]